MSSVGDRTDRLATMCRFAAAAALAEQLEDAPGDAGTRFLREAPAPRSALPQAAGSGRSRRRATGASPGTPQRGQRIRPA